MRDNHDKWQRVYQTQPAMPAAAEVLVQNRHLLPPAGQGLDLACGLAANAVMLAGQGIETEAWDQSSEAIGQISSHARQAQLQIRAEVRDVVAHPPAPASFDVIVVSRFLDRGLCPAISAALRPGGLLFYQTFSAHKVSEQGPSNPDYLLADNELLQLFADLQIRVYREEKRLGNMAQGFRNQVMLVAEKPYGDKNLL